MQRQNNEGKLKAIVQLYRYTVQYLSLPVSGDGLLKVLYWLWT